MTDLPPVLGHFARNRVIVLVTGRTAVARVGGVTAVRRHVATALRLGLEPVVLYPARMRALGAEIAGEVDGQARCLPSDALTDEAGGDGELALVIAGDWYIAPNAIIAFSHETRGPAVARFLDRGRVVAPLARMHVREVRALIPGLAQRSSGALINGGADDASTVFPLAVGQRHRLSDNLAIARCEAKLFGWFGAAAAPRHVSIVQRALAVPITRRLAGTQTTPTQISIAKMVSGLSAAWVFTAGGYLAGLLGAALYFFSRVLDTVSGDLSRAAVVEGARGEKTDVAGDIVVMLTILAALVASSTLAYAAWLGLVTAVGVTISAAVSYTRVFRWTWQAGTLGLDWGERQQAVSSDNFASRFWRSNGLAYALLLAAVVGRLDLFLWAGALGSHLFYVLWLTTDARTAR